MKNSLGHELAALLRLACPLISAQLAHALMIFTDTLMMAMLGPQQLAGGALGATCYFIFSIFCTRGDRRRWQPGRHSPWCG